MKKTYFAPEMEIVNIKNQQLLAGSTNAPVDDDNTQDNGDALSPEFYF